MNPLKSTFFRPFAIGFAVGAALLLASTDNDVRAENGRQQGAFPAMSQASAATAAR